ncbi:hypothetical protein FRC09_016671 [Ceratobasidium sp. 395]|nr:hypothetical protein FRC09_016671 [Ceratobasidium sp. 395]
MAASIITPKFRLSLDSISSTTVLEKSTTGAFGITTMPNVYSEAFKAWKDAHAPFKTAIAVYSDAYLAFHAICSSPLVENTTQPMLEGVLAALDSEILGLASDIKQVTSANKTVRLLRNKSTTLVRISILPAELLTRVFELFCYSPEKLGEMNRLARLPWTLACVNTYWRQLTVNNSYLWARLNLVAGRRPDEQARTQLTYARNLPLDVMLDTVKERATFMFSRAPEDLLIEVAPRLRSLTYHADRMTSYSPSDILSHWIRHGTPGTGHRLNLLSYQLLEPDDVRFEIQSNPMSMERIEAFFAPVQYLALHHLYVGWSSALYHGLIELDLNFSSSFIQFPTATEFAAILSASPGLRALKLHGFGLNAQDEQHAVEPIRLDYLQVLFLGEIHRRSLNRLLAMIQPGSIPLYMRFDLQKQSADIWEIIVILPENCSLP